MPKWLEFGHPVVLGGIKPNVCESPTAALGSELVGGWPCFPSQLRDRFAKKPDTKPSKKGDNEKQ
jgi:hypothetical protein